MGARVAVNTRKPNLNDLWRCLSIIIMKPKSILPSTTDTGSVLAEFLPRCLYSAQHAQLVLNWILKCSEIYLYSIPCRAAHLIAPFMNESVPDETVESLTVQKEMAHHAFDGGAWRLCAFSAVMFTSSQNLSASFAFTGINRCNIWEIFSCVLGSYSSEKSIFQLWPLWLFQWLFAAGN